MKVTTEAKGGVLIHRISGRIDTATSPEAEGKLTAEVKQGKRVALDMNAVAYVSSAGLRVVLMAAKLAKANAGAVVLFGLQPTVREVFAISGFDRVVAIREDEAAALAVLGS
ncbi:STAS domain-containing protein [Plastoroseomonas hellenica]|uniref:Anti-sigma factor antagonist n=1 Tax=Plastoroseomonas hellenica TaxID=2687306 RepID=A0ABS5F526_9PROT|nr:STAS domain-containing protein [Plastoroseomonas hellenica]MBR0645708.1 STAS domain-containing protein [Plastoroseomonas hellenica]MBR0667669.1 STAS domain-containing protein [Plastoroseomonas hellenica]